MGPLWLFVAVLMCTGEGQGIWGQWYFQSMGPTVPFLGTVDLFLSPSSSSPDAASSFCVNATYGAATSAPISLQSCPSTEAASTALPSSKFFAPNVFLGIEFKLDTPRLIGIANVTKDNGSTAIMWNESVVVLTSEGQRQVVVQTVILVGSDSQRMTFSQSWSSEWIMTYTLSRKQQNSKKNKKLVKPEAKEAEKFVPPQRKLLAGPSAYFTALSDDWTVATGAIGVQTLWLSLAGLANRDGPTLFLRYPDGWAFSYTPQLLNYYATAHNFSFSELATPKDALNALRTSFSGYFIWDKNVTNSISVAFTAAGLARGLVITEDQLPLMQELGIPELGDFRGKFSGLTDSEIIQWSYEQYFHQCNKSFVIWLGGECCQILYPAVADFGVMSGIFFAGDLSTKPSDTIEYALSNQIVSSLDPYAVAVGWHSYIKDEEHYFTTLMSTHGARVHGLNTLPNLAFNNKVKLLPGFQFKNHHTTYSEPKSWNKTFVSFVQTDGLGLGAWDKPGRGTLPYTWEVTVNDLWMQPTLLEMFYANATSNDYFIGALSSAGYTYPKALGREHLPHLLRLASSFMKQLDLNAYDIMDSSEGQETNGNMNLPEWIVQMYYSEMPFSIGFVNGYGPSFTFALNGTRPFLSFDYYLDPSRTVEDAAADLVLLSQLNNVRPYFLVAHIREFSDIERVEQIWNALPQGEFELVSTDWLLQAAGRNPTFTTRFEDSPQ